MPLHIILNPMYAHVDSHVLKGFTWFMSNPFKFWEPNVRFYKDNHPCLAFPFALIITNTKTKIPEPYQDNMYQVAKWLRDNGYSLIELYRLPPSHKYLSISSNFNPLPDTRYVNLYVEGSQVYIRFAIDLSDIPASKTLYLGSVILGCSSPFRPYFNALIQYIWNGSDIWITQNKQLPIFEFYIYLNVI